MKALSSLWSAINQSSFVGIIALVSLLPYVVPQQALAAELQTSGQSAQIFQIKIEDPTLLDPSQKPNLQNSITIDDLANNDPLTAKLASYLEQNDSPMADEAGKFIQYPQWQRAVAISFVESNFCKKAMNKNCTSIGVAPGDRLWRKYSNYADWMADMSKLMEKPIYKDRLNTFQKMKGVYVVPGSSAWVNGAQKKYDELMALTEQAETDRQALAQQQNLELATISTFDQKAN